VIYQQQTLYEQLNKHSVPSARIITHFTYFYGRSGPITY